MSKVIVDEIQTDTADGNVRIIPNGTGKLEIKGAGGDDAMIRLNCSAQTHGVKIKSPNHNAGQSYTMILPDNNIEAGKFLKVKSVTGTPANEAVGQLEYADAGGGAYEFVSETTISISANYFDFTGLDDDSIYLFVGKKVVLSTANWPEFSFLDSSGNASINALRVSDMRTAFYSSGGAGSTGTFGGTYNYRPNTWPGVSSLQHSFTLTVSTPAVNCFFMWDGVATDQTSMAYGITRGGLYRNSGTDRIHGVRFHAGGGSSRTFDPPTEVILYKLKES